VRFGSAAPLVGVVTDPGADRRLENAPAVVFLNSGLLHRVGACRMHVRLARALAAEGLVSLRFDFSGLGDSEPRRDSLPFERSGVLETQEAMQLLNETRGVSKFVLVGLCSGADMAFYTAIEDTRVRGLVQLDAFAYRTWKYYVVRYAPRLVRARSWLNLLQGKTYIGAYLRNLRRKGNGKPGDEAKGEMVQSPYVRAFPSRESVAAGLRTLTGRGVRLFHIFSSGQEDHFNHRAQYVTSFADVDFRGLLRVEFVRGASHIFTDLRHQAWLDTEVTSWIAQLAGGDTLPAPSTKRQAHAS